MGFLRKIFRRKSDVHPPPNSTASPTSTSATPNENTVIVGSSSNVNPNTSTTSTRKSSWRNNHHKTTNVKHGSHASSSLQHRHSSTGREDSPTQLILDGKRSFLKFQVFALCCLKPFDLSSFFLKHRTR